GRRCGDAAARWRQGAGGGLAGVALLAGRRTARGDRSGARALLSRLAAFQGRQGRGDHARGVPRPRLADRARLRRRLAGDAGGDADLLGQRDERGRGSPDRGCGDRAHGIRAGAGGDCSARGLAPPQQHRPAARRDRAESRRRQMSAAAGLAQDEAFARIRLLRSPNIGPISYAELLRRFGSALAALEALPELAARGGRDYRPAPVARIEDEVAAVRGAGAHYLFHDAPGYPPLLAAFEGAPPILRVRGDVSFTARPCAAIVGARNASAAAVKLARDFAHALAEAGFAVVSGLARGIDGAAHEGALPATIGVIASGIDVAYPPQHTDLQERVATEGLLVAEQPPGTEPRGSHFPSRNRIIAGLALGTLVVEAAPKSGSLITARLAGEAGREVMAIPGSPLDARSQGCNQL